MHILIRSTIHTLKKTKNLLNQIDNASLIDKTIAPYYSSIGSHIRHILDFYECILNDTNFFDLTCRQRDIKVETDCESALIYLNELEGKLMKIDELKIDRLVEVIDDLGLGKAKVTYTFGALLSQANSHTIHHYAIINYILEGLNLKFDDNNFGYNPTTPKAFNLN